MQMSEWFGIRGYAMKNCIMDYASSFEAQINLARSLTGHSRESLTVTKNYTKATIFGAIIKMVNNICIP
jgi:hypothetical protein